MNNPLYPAFFRLDRLQLLVVGAGAVGEEKLSFILKSSPNARVVIVAPWMGEELKSLLEEQHGAGARSRDPLSLVVTTQDEGHLARSQVQGEGQGSQVPPAAAEDPALAGYWTTAAGGSVTWLARAFRREDVEMADLVVAATNFKDVNLAVHTAAKSARRLANIADTPDLCDFYLGSIVTRGPLKIAISTNGQSPTFAKRFRQWLEAELPELETTSLLDNLKTFRDRLTGDFEAKVRQLNAVTNSLLSATHTGAACQCPAGECLVEAAARTNSAPSSSLSPSGGRGELLPSGGWVGPSAPGTEKNT
ncbi:bifunctional precorrin-2 dehydrogenase/sirohydrochlorin ferrochelatase [Neolewinella lacunae]|uniref:precorrin-2 dehydrogenase n=1 Tax=Neolewinella lacunae TaxID=1517758 RepID=A0A923PP20_9BACT|nr:bifunctional precorrin-2 dehydrogenase/sirohydrochlorin ferrochelatase [Neolewinella lacunae]MBC6994849.1 bifunctional precorrin-2 dehydrogenase/sirohydrochlorin ferrochelatase [Neolewinella lacunae]MDN3636769.1 bifunctional precorrin-2 dehydrogenase/sirohydrochlorin ferrochelatase [Neolewinella lacunae]